MESDLPLFPEQASTVAPQVDALYFFLVGISGFFTVLIAALIVYFAIKYRRGSKAERQQGDRSTLPLELTWILIPLAINMVIFVWGTSLYFETEHPPSNAMKIYVVGKQWMWKFKHPTGNREINELHVPLGQPVVLEMISEDVIHDLFVPAFRVKNDVRPGAHSRVWFQATKTGSFHLFCAEYCGAEHSRMVGRVIVMEPNDYQQWLSGETRGETPELAGQRLFEQLRCGTCHQGGGRGPALEGVFGSEVLLANGQTVVADEGYIRRSILDPQKEVVKGFEPIMPAYAGQLSEEDLIDLGAYIRSLSKK